MIRQLQAMGFHFGLVLADSLDGESKVSFVNGLDELKLPYILAIRSNHALWLLHHLRHWWNIMATRESVRMIADGVVYVHVHVSPKWFTRTGERKIA